MAESEAPLSRPVAHRFVGREVELAELRAALENARCGRGQVFLLVGDAGIGKTRLAEEICSAALGEGALVAWGRCWEDGGAPAFWPWVQVFRSLAAVLDDEVLRQTLGEGAAQLAALAPEIAARAGVPPQATAVSTLESPHARFPLFDAVTRFLERLGARRPLVVVLDDLHAADEPSLLLLEFLARDLRSAPLLVIGTYREVEAHRQAEHARLLNAVARCGHRVPLRGLTRQEVGRLVQIALPKETPARLGELRGRVFEITEGNPFFVDEIVRLLRAGGASSSELVIPQGIREAVRQQLRPLSPRAYQVLGAAAVIGREFDLALLQELCEAREDRSTYYVRRSTFGAVLTSNVERNTSNEDPAPSPQSPAPGLFLDLLGEAEVAGVAERQSGSLARYSFSHALIRDTLYEDLTPSQRAHLHWQAGEILERQHAGDTGAPLAEIARHFLRGVGVGGARKAVGSPAGAGDRAAALLAYEEAAACYQQALEALSLIGVGGTPDPRPLTPEHQRVELLLSLGEMQARAWNTTSAQQTFQQAAELVRGLHADAARTGTWLARAALGFGRTGLGVPRGHVADARLVRLLEEALAALPDDEPALRARVLTRLAVELYFSDTAARRTAMCEEAAQLARRSGDDSTLAYVVMAQHFASWDSPDVDWRLSIANEGVELAQRAGELDLEVVSRLWRILDLVEKGDVGRWGAELDEMDQRAQALRQPRPMSFAATLRGMRALWRGRFDELEGLWQSQMEIATRVQDTAGSVNVGIQRLALQRLLGQQEEQLPVVSMWVERLHGEATVRCLRAVLHADLGHEDEARQDFETLAETDFLELQRSNRLNMSILPWLAEVCSFLRDRERAAQLHRFLLPYARQNMVGGPRLFFGPAAYYLGLLAATLGRYDEAVEHLEYALERSRAMDGPPATAAAQHQLARVLVERGGSGDRERAREMLRPAAATAAQLGLAHLAVAVQRLAEELDRTPLERQAERLRAAAGSSAYGGEGEAAQRPAAAGGRVLLFPAKGGDRARPDAAPTTADKRPEYVFRREGEFWTVSDGSSTLRLKDTKGLRYIAQLLQHPDREFHVIDLVAPERAPGDDDGALRAAANEKELHRLGMHTARDAEVGERLLDSQARGAYQRRLEDLRDELDEATRFNDTERASRARIEMDFLARELARAVGLGGRDRAGASGAERARLNVTRAVKAVLRRIASGNPNLGRYLETTIRTGAFCSYRPDARLKVSWKL